MSVLPRQPGDPISADDWIYILTMLLTIGLIAAILIIILVMLPLISYFLTPAPDQIVRFYFNGSALLGNGTIINLSNLTGVY